MRRLARARRARRARGRARLSCLRVAARARRRARLDARRARSTAATRPRRTRPLADGTDAVRRELLDLSRRRRQGQRARAEPARASARRRSTCGSRAGWMPLAVPTARADQQAGQVHRRSRRSRSPTTSRRSLRAGLPIPTVDSQGRRASRRVQPVRAELRALPHDHRRRRRALERARRRRRCTVSPRPRSPRRSRPGPGNMPRFDPGALTPARGRTTSSPT